MRPTNARSKATFLLAVLATVLGALSLSILVLQVWPPRLLMLTEAETSSLSVEARLTAEAAVRSAILSILAGFIATGVSIAALRQASLARRSHEHQKQIDWSKGYSEAAKMLSDSNPTSKVAGVVGLCALAGTKVTEANYQYVVSALVAFVQNASARDSEAIIISLRFLLSDHRPKSLSFSGAQLKNIDLTEFSFDGVDLNGTSFRGSTLSKSQRELVAGHQGVDTGEVKWV